MEPQTIVTSSVLMLALTGLGGLVMLLVRMRGQVIPDWLAMGHGFFAAAALALLIYTAVFVGLPATAWIGLLLLGLAGGVGIHLNLTYQTQHRVLPFALVVAHALAAVAGVVLVTLAAFRV